MNSAVPGDIGRDCGQPILKRGRCVRRLGGYGGEYRWPGIQTATLGFVSPLTCERNQSQPPSPHYGGRPGLMEPQHRKYPTPCHFVSKHSASCSRDLSEHLWSVMVAGGRRTQPPQFNRISVQVAFWTKEKRSSQRQEVVLSEQRAMSPFWDGWNPREKHGVAKPYQKNWSPRWQPCGHGNFGKTYSLLM